MERDVVFNRLPILLGVILVIGSVATLGACPDEKDKAPIKVTLVLILASEEGNTIDPRLKAIAEEIQKLNRNLKSFSLKSMQSKSLKPGDRVSLPLIEDKKVDLVVNSGADMDNRVRLSVFAPSMGEIEYQSVCGKFLPIVTRCKTKSGERLILAIRLQPCRGE